MGNEHKLSEIGVALETVLNNSNLNPVGGVWLNLESMVPELPAILIEPQVNQREMQQTGFTTQNKFIVHFTVLYSKLGSERDTNQDCLKLAENLETVLHNNRRLGGRLIHSLVNSIELGAANRQNVTIRAARLVWTGMSKTRLPPL